MELNGEKDVNVEIEEVFLKPIHVLFIDDIVELSPINRESETSCEEIYNFICQIGLKPGRKIALLDPKRKTALMKVAIEITQGFSDGLLGFIEFMTIEGGKAVMAHYKGTWEDISHPYEVIDAWLVQNKKKAKGKPFVAYRKDFSLGKDKDEFIMEAYQLFED